MANCAHGFPEGQCLICRTLGVQSSGKAAQKTKLANPKRSGTTLADDDLAALLPATRTRSDSLERSGGRRRKRSGIRALMTIVGAIVVGGLLVWAFAGIFDLAFHIFEYVAIALVAGWVGYKLGHAVGRHEGRG